MSVTNALKIARHGCFAHFPGSGPDRTCRECGHFKKAKNEGRCAKYAELVEKKVAKVGTIPGSTKACRYYHDKTGATVDPEQIGSTQRASWTRSPAPPPYRHPSHQRNLNMRKSDLYPSRYIKAEDLQGREWPLTIASLTTEVIDSERGKETMPLLTFHGVQKGLILNVTNYDSIAAMHGEETDNWAGKSVKLYPDKTRFGGKIVDCVRVRTQNATPAMTEVPPPDPALQAPAEVPPRPAAPVAPETELNDAIHF